MISARSSLQNVETIIKEVKKEEKDLYLIGQLALLLHLVELVHSAYIMKKEDPGIG